MNSRMLSLALTLACCMAIGSAQADTDGKFSYRFLWPADPARPGRDLVELSMIELESTGMADTLLGPAGAVTFSLALPSGEVVARTRVLSVRDREGIWVIESEIIKEITAPTGDYLRPHFALPAVSAPPGYRHVLDFAIEEFVTPLRYAEATTGPVLMYNNKLEVLVMSPLDNFMDAMQAPVRGEWLCGFGGLIERVPAGTRARTILVEGTGINAAFMKWGEAIQTWYGHRPADPYADVAMSRLGYWTDNGSYYYYRTEPGMDYHQTLIAVQDYARSEGIPYGYFQLDSWWYPKAATDDRSSHGRGGFLLWEPNPDMFPQGLPEFRRELGLPLVAHNRYPARQSPYCDKYECVYGDDEKKPAAYPIDPAFWDEIMDNAVDYGVAVYEQDWLYTHMDIIPWMRSGFGNAASWYDAMASAADRRGITMQLCMASPEFFLQQLKHGNETHARTSHDYKGGLPKAFFWMPFHKSSLFAWAVGLWPFKDNFQTTRGQRPTYNIIPEANPWGEALVATLSGGPVGPSDRIGGSDRDLILKTCRTDGLLLKPDRPATPIDVMFLCNKNIFTGGRKPWVVTTKSDHDLGRTTYLAAFNLWPQSMYQPFVSLQEAGVGGPHLIYDYHSGEFTIETRQVSFGFMPPEKAFYYVLCPLLDNGMAVLGETGKFITMSRKRFPRAGMVEGALEFEIEGVPGEKIEIAIYSPRPLELVEGAREAGVTGAGLYLVALDVPESGRAVVRVK